MNTVEDRPPATEPAKGISFQAMQRAGIFLVRVACHQKGVRGWRDLNVRTGLEDEKAKLVLPEGHLENWSDFPSGLSLNGKEWDNLLSLRGISYGVDWLACASSLTDEEADDLIFPIVGELEITDYATAFFLKASGVTLPSEPAEVVGL